MHFLDRFNIYSYHRRRLKSWGGNNPKVQGWSSIESQQARFDAISHAVDFESKRVLDLGCGLGELYDYLAQDYSLESYLGMDQHRPFLRAAKKRVGSSEVQFKYGDISQFNETGIDVIVACGSLNYQSRDPDYISKIITRMYHQANEAVVFNLLDSEFFHDKSLLKAYNRTAIFRFCKMLSNNVRLIDNYASDDFTIVMRK
ncbi:class I SAM-dependent methyltransferase [Vibrio makurazakiensis]|uniref:class I SAM-dependent methyltransferase n=1 Tax=Vibrio makurazakiensis TaxID=2910250 RepID=UPI003D0C113B